MPSGPSTGAAAQTSWSGPSPSARKWWQRGSEADRVEAQLAEARRLVPIQSDPLLGAQMSRRERAAEQRAQRRVRAARRKVWTSAELASVRRQTDALQLETELADQAAADQRWHRRAESDRDRMTSQAVRVGQLARSIRQRRLVLLTVAYVAVAWGAVNVQSIIAAHFHLTMIDPAYWLAYCLEPLLTVPLIQMMKDRATMAEWGRALAWRKSWPVFLVEAGLLATTMGISAGPRFADGPVAALYLVPSVMIAVSMILLPHGAHQLGEILAGARDDAAEQDALANEESALAKFVARATTVFEAVGRDEISGERDENGVPSASAIRAHQACNKGTAITLRKLLTSARS